MNLTELAESRRQRLLEFLDRKYEGNKAALGRALGYRDGAFIGQMLRGERPITEKTIDQVHSMPGGKGWFDAQTLSPPLLQNQPTFFSPTVTVGPPPLSDYARDLAVLFDRLTTTENRADVAEACRELIRIKTTESQSSAPNQSSRKSA